MKIRNTLSFKFLTSQLGIWLLLKKFNRKTVAPEHILPYFDHLQEMELNRIQSKKIILDRITNKNISKVRMKMKLIDHEIADAENTIIKMDKQIEQLEQLSNEF